MECRLLRLIIQADLATEKQWLVPDVWSQVITTAFGLLVGLLGDSWLRIVGRVALAVFELYKFAVLRLWRNRSGSGAQDAGVDEPSPDLALQDTAQSDTEVTPLLPQPPKVYRRRSRPAKAIELGPSGEPETGLKLSRRFGAAAGASALRGRDESQPLRQQLRIVARNVADDKYQAVVLFLLSIFVFALIIGLPVAAVFISFAASDHVALASSPMCGVYLPDRQKLSGQERYMASIPYSIDIETEAREYARQCYISDTSNSCQYFSNQSIQYTISNTAPCPFAAQMCTGPENTALLMTTGLIPANTLGINAPRGYQFNRTTVCSPVLRNDSLIQRGKASSGKVEWLYYYGTFLGSGNISIPLTWTTPDKTAGFDASGYTAA